MEYGREQFILSFMSWLIYFMGTISNWEASKLTVEYFNIAYDNEDALITYRALI